MKCSCLTARGLCWFTVINCCVAPGFHSKYLRRLLTVGILLENLAITFYQQCEHLDRKDSQMVILNI